MIQQFKYQLTSMILLGGIFFCYQNFDFNKSLKVSLLPSNESARVDHAQELLGHNFVGSSAQRLDGGTDLGTSIFNEVYMSLPILYKEKSVELADTIVKESAKYQMDPVFVLAVIKTESHFNPEVIGRYGEIGLMQIKPKTAEWIAKKLGRRWTGAKSLFNPVTNVKISLAYMSYLRRRFKQDPTKYIAAYNMGVTNVNRSIASGGRPREYSDRVLGKYFQTYKSLLSRSNSRFFAFNESIFL